MLADLKLFWMVWTHSSQLDTAFVSNSTLGLSLVWEIKFPGEAAFRTSYMFIDGLSAPDPINCIFLQSKRSYSVREFIMVEQKDPSPERTTCPGEYYACSRPFAVLFQYTFNSGQKTL